MARKCKITIDHTKVVATMTGFVYILTEDNLPSEMFDADGGLSAKSDGGDVRLYSDIGLTNELPIHVRAFNTDNNPANGYAEIATKSNISSVTDTEIWVYYNDSTLSMYAEGDTYGKHAVYSGTDYVGVWPFQTDSWLDATANNTDLTEKNTNAPAAAVIQNGVTYNSNTTVATANFLYDSTPSSALQINDDIAMEAWFKADSTYSAERYSTTCIRRTAATIAGTDWIFDIDRNTGRYRFYISNGSSWAGYETANSTVTYDTYVHIAVIYNSTDGADIYKNGVKLSLAVDDTPHVGQTANNKFIIGGDDILSVTLNPEGGNDELRIGTGTAINEAWVQTTYNNQSDFPNWASAGTPITSGQSARIMLII